MAAIVFVLGAIQAKKYYDTRYKGQEYYTMVPSDQDSITEEFTDMNGKKTGIIGKKYKLIAFDKEGNQRELEFSVKEDKLLKPNQYIKITASKEIVLYHSLITEKEVPSKALEMIKSKIK